MFIRCRSRRRNPFDYQFVIFIAQPQPGRVGQFGWVALLTAAHTRELIRAFGIDSGHSIAHDKLKSIQI